MPDQHGESLFVMYLYKYYIDVDDELCAHCCWIWLFDGVDVDLRLFCLCYIISCYNSYMLLKYI